MILLSFWGNGQGSSLIPRTLYAVAHLITIIVTSNTVFIAIIIIISVTTEFLERNPFCIHYRLLCCLSHHQLYCLIPADSLLSFVCFRSVIWWWNEAISVYFSSRPYSLFCKRSKEPNFYRKCIIVGQEIRHDLKILSDHFECNILSFGRRHYWRFSDSQGMQSFTHTIYI